MAVLCLALAAASTVYWCYALGCVARFRRRRPPVATAALPPVTVLKPLCGAHPALYESAEHDVVVIADSDIRVGPDYLRTVVAPLADPRVGLVTCLYRAGGTGRRWGALARLFIDEWFFPSAVVSATGGPMRHAFGATLALRRRALAAIGGFQAVGAYLADDYVLGARIAAHGGRVVLSPYVVETRVVERSFAALFLHELRWSRTMRAVRPVGYFLRR